MSESKTSLEVVLPIQPANHFSLSGSGISVDYATTSLTGTPRLHYQDTTRTLNFEGAEIRTVEVADLGTVVSVTLNITVDVGSTTFSVLIPPVETSGIGGSAPLSTEGITATHKAPLAPQINFGQRILYHVAKLHGTANHIVA
jgi:hypothetical protein